MKKYEAGKKLADAEFNLALPNLEKALELAPKDSPDLLPLLKTLKQSYSLMGMSDKSQLPKLKGLVANNNQWDGFCEMLQFNIEQQQRKLEQATELREIHQAQGAITMLRQMKYLKEEINAHK